MQLGIFKSGIVASLVVLLAIGSSFCACLDMLSFSEHASHQVMDEPHDMGAHGLNQGSKQTPHSEGGCEDCQHLTWLKAPPQNFDLFSGTNNALELEKEQLAPDEAWRSKHPTRFVELPLGHSPPALSPVQLHNILII